MCGILILGWYFYLMQTGLAVGLGRHINELKIPAARAYYYSSLFQWTMEHAYTFSITASQLSLLALYWRAFESIHGVRTAIIPLALFVLIWFLVRVLPVHRVLGPG
jgi:hypothetical protein